MGTIIKINERNWPINSSGIEQSISLKKLSPINLESKCAFGYKSININYSILLTPLWIKLSLRTTVYYFFRNAIKTNFLDIKLLFLIYSLCKCSNDIGFDFHINVWENNLNIILLIMARRSKCLWFENYLRIIHK